MTTEEHLSAEEIARELERLNRLRKERKELINRADRVEKETQQLVEKLRRVRLDMTLH